MSAILYLWGRSWQRQNGTMNIMQLKFKYRLPDNQIILIVSCCLLLLVDVFCPTNYTWYLVATSFSSSVILVVYFINLWMLYLWNSPADGSLDHVVLTKSPLEITHEPLLAQSVLGIQQDESVVHEKNFGLEATKNRSAFLLLPVNHEIFPFYGWLLKSHV